MIDIRQVAKSYVSRAKTVRAIGNITTEIGEGEFVSIVGPSGCGKSTLLHILAGFEEPTAGNVAIDGVQVRRGVVPAGLGYIFQKDTVLPWRSVRENIALGPKFRGTNRKLVGQKVDSLLTLGGLDGFGDAFPHQLSGGMRRRVALLMTLACDPRVLLLDEPFGALDTHTRTLLHRELLTIWRQMRQTVVLVTHDLDEAITLSDRILVLSRPPSTVLLDHKVDIPHPRDVFSVRETLEFTHHFRTIWKVLGDQFRDSNEPGIRRAREEHPA